ncbi:MAG: cytochrome c oxidase subunit II [Anaerolineae bacterium]|nr:cytochrome c oxidase subunit II [Anaerolineae bacterium]
MLSGCAAAPSTLAPQGQGAAEIAMLWWIMFWLATGVFIAVMGLLFYALFRSRTGHPEESQTESRRDNLLIIGGGVTTLIILVVVYFFTLRTINVLAAATPEAEFTIEVVGRQWWWEVYYPNQQVITANEIHIPVGQRVALKVTSGDVIHSFWVPQLHGKIDMIPGQTNTLWLQADRPGQYYGVCAEYCGIQHAKMAFIVVAEPLDEFREWLEQQSRPAVEAGDPLTQEGQELFLSTNCSQCHTISGTSASGTLGPDLTHFASRSTLGAGILPNTREHLAQWILNPQQIKQGNLMPATQLTEPKLEALVAYLQNLE